MSKKSSIAIFIAATSALSISMADSNKVKAGENDLGGLKEWNTDMPVSYTHLTLPTILLV